MIKSDLLAMMLGLVMAPQAWAAGRSGYIERTNVCGVPVTIARDAYGVPRVYAGTASGLFMGDGYAVAEDRAWQMEKYRLDAEGRLAEIFGSRLVEHDKEVRRDGATRAQWDAQFSKLPRAIQQVFQAYARGVNCYFTQAAISHTLPSVFQKYQVSPAPWSVADSMAISGMMENRFGGSGIDQLRNLAVIEYLARRLGSRQKAMEVFNDLAWTDDPAAITTIGSEAYKVSKRGSADSVSRTFLPVTSLRSLAALSSQANSAAVYRAAEKLRLPTKWGSYAWALAPSRTASGNAILLGGPQMGFGTPSIAHEIQLTGAGYNVIGMDFPGVPGILIGTNNHLAWTTTSGATHNEDVFIETLKPGHEHQYLHHGHYRRMERRVDLIKIKGQHPLRYDVWSTVHGPVIGWSPDKRFAYSKAVSYAGQQWRTAIGFLGLMRARRINDVAPLARDVVSNHNIIVATRKGDIGYWHCGLFPTYPKGVDPRLPLRGTGEDDWTGFLPFRDLPHVIDPPSGFLFNWNNKPAPGWVNYYVPAWGFPSGVFDIQHGLQHELADNGGKLTFNEVQAVARYIAYHDYRADVFIPALIEAAAHARTRLSPDEGRALSYLRHWNGRRSDGCVACAIFDAWYRQLTNDIFRETLGDLGKESRYERFTQGSTSALYHILQGPNSSIKLHWHWLGGRSPDEVRLEALKEALHELRKDDGPEMSTWQFHTGWIEFTPLPRMPAANRGTYIQEIELAHPQMRGVWILPPGESENPKSPHYSDQLPLAGWWMFTPMNIVSKPVYGGDRARCRD